MDKLMGSLHDSSASMAAHAAVNAPTQQQIVAIGDAATQQLTNNLMEQEMNELMRDDPSSSVGQPGDPSTQKYIYAPPRNVLVIPNFDIDKPNCYNDSIWNQTLAPVPKAEIFLPIMAKKKLIGPGISEKDAKYPPSIPNFPIKFDRLLGYRQFLS